MTEVFVNQRDVCPVRPGSNDQPPRARGRKGGRPRTSSDIRRETAKSMLPGGASLAECERAAGRRDALQPQVTARSGWLRAGVA